VPDAALGEVAAAIRARLRSGRLAARARNGPRALAGFKMPRRSIYDAMPMTATNKIQRATLRQWIGESRLTRVV